MAKRKRGEHGNGFVDVGLGAALAQIRGQSDSCVDKKAADDDGGGWTVVGASKKRRKERNNTPPRVSPLEKHSGHTGSFSATEDLSAAGASAPQQSDHQMTRQERRKERKLQRNYPNIEHSHHARLQSHVKLSDLQSLVLYLLADGHAPQWVSVRSRSNIQQVVMLMVPGLDVSMFSGETSLGDTSTTLRPDNLNPSTETAGPRRLKISPDDFYPAALKSDKLPDPLRPLSEIFEHVWPVKAAGEHRNNQYIKVHSPIHSMLTSQIPKTQEEKQMKKSGNHKGPVPQNAKHWENQRTSITEYVATLVEQQENEYVLHPAMFITPESKAAALDRRKKAKQTAEEGWVDTNVASLDEGSLPDAEIEKGSITAGRQILSVDCEMCKSVDDELVLTRISLLDWDGNVVVDELVKPDVPIKDYLTQWSGITAEMLQDVTTSLKDIQTRLTTLLTPRTILVGHSLNSDLNALKMTHPFLIDTGILYPHPRGPPYKQSLKWLAQKFLRREVQKGSQGHNSVEDARTCLDLVKQKCEKGPRWGSGDTNAESIFKRLGRSPRPTSHNIQRCGAVVDWGDPNRGHGGQAQIAQGCKSDAEVVEAIRKVVNGQETTKEGTAGKVDFVWGRLRELELARGWWDEAKSADIEVIRQNALENMGMHVDENHQAIEAQGSALGHAVKQTVDRIVEIYDSLPRFTAFVVYSGTGDPREVRRLQAMQQQYRREYATKNWDNLSVKWTDTEVQALSRACQTARNGVGLIVVK